MKRIVLLIFLIVVLMVPEGAAAPTLSVVPSNQEVSVGDTFTVDINVEPDGTEVYAAAFYLNYMFSKLNATNIEKGQFLTRDGTSSFVLSDCDNEVSQCNYLETRISVKNGVISSGTLATITFRAEYPGVVPLNMTRTEIADSNASKITEMNGLILNNGSVSINPDLIDPTISISSPAEGKLFNDPAIMVTGTASDNAGIKKVEVKVGTGTWKTAAGTATWTIPVTLQEGTNTIYAKVTDNSGNTKQAQVIVTYDGTTPVITITSPTGGQVFNNPAITVSGTASDNIGINKVEVKIGTGAWKTATGTTTWSLPVTLPEGMDTIYAKVTDNSGNTKQEQVTVTYDGTTPAITITSPTSGQSFSDPAITVTGTASDNIGINKVEVKVGAGAWKTATGTTAWTIQVMLAAGTNTIYAMVTDNSGNTKQAQVTVTYDGTIPTITITSPADGQVFNDPAITVTGAASDDVLIEKVEVKVGAGVWKTATGTTTWTIPVTLAAGTNIIYVKVTDDSENTEQAQVTVTYPPDTTPPMTVIIHPEEEAYLKGNITIKGTVSDTDLETWTIEWKNATTGWEEIHNSSTPVNDGTLAIWDTKELIDGIYTIRLNATDKAFNTNITSVNVIIDNTEPDISITEPRKNENIRFFDNIVRGEIKDINLESASIVVRNEANDVVSSYELTITDSTFIQRVEYAPDQNNTIELNANDRAGNSNITITGIFVSNNTIQEELEVNNSEPVTIDARNESDTELEFVSNVTGNMTITVTGITDALEVESLNGSANILGEMATGKIVKIDVDGLGAENEKEVQYVTISFYYNKTDLDLDGDGTVEPGELDENNLFIYWLNTTTGNWTKLLKDNPDWVIDNGINKIESNNQGNVWVKVRHLSTFGLAAAKVTQKNDGGTSTSSSGGGGGGGGASSTETYKNVEIRERYEKVVYKDVKTIYQFKKNGHVENIDITGNRSSGLVNVMVEILRNTSTLVNEPAPGIIYKNMNLWVGTSGFAIPKNIKEASITFRVNRSWIDENNINKVILYRYSNGNWVNLPAEKIHEDGDIIRYRAKSNRFSPFAISGVRTEQSTSEMAAPPIVTQPAAPVTKETVTSEEIDTVGILAGILGFALPAGEGKVNPFLMLATILAIALGLRIFLRKER